MVREARAEAVAEIGGRVRVVATGRIRDRKLRLTYRHLTRGRYRLTLLEFLGHHKMAAIGHTSLVIS
jgi:hypothetical protein